MYQDAIRKEKIIDSDQKKNEINITIIFNYKNQLLFQPKKKLIIIDLMRTDFRIGNNKLIRVLEEHTHKHITL